jgi:hypothetical protein
LPPSPFGEIAALLTRAFSFEPHASQGQSSGKGWREQEMTRHPAEEKRLTVAWPMPREPPVSSKVFRTSLRISGVRA